MPTESTREDEVSMYGEGRIVVPKPLRDAHDIGRKDTVTIKVYNDQGESKQFTRKMGVEGRVTIPKKIREKLGIVGADSVDIELTNHIPAL